MAPQPLHFRAYFNEPIVDDGNVSSGGAFVRHFDFEAGNLEHAQELAERERGKGEELGDLVQLAPDWGRGNL